MVYAFNGSKMALVFAAADDPEEVLAGAESDVTLVGSVTKSLSCTTHGDSKVPLTIRLLACLSRWLALMTQVCKRC